MLWDFTIARAIEATGHDVGEGCGGLNEELDGDKTKLCHINLRTSYFPRVHGDI